MSLRQYGQFCGFARALEIIGERAFTELFFIEALAAG